MYYIPATVFNIFYTSKTVMQLFSKTAYSRLSQMDRNNYKFMHLGPNKIQKLLASILWDISLAPSIIVRGGRAGKLWL